MIRIAVAVAVAGGSAAGCGLGAPPKAPNDGTAQAAAAADPWRLEASGTAGVALVSLGPSGDARLRIACRRAPAGLFASWPGAARIGSEERLTVGAGDTLAVLVVGPEIGEGQPVAGSGPPAPEFLAALEAGRAVGASYGAAALGPLPPPGAELRGGFARACRAAWGQ